MFRKYTAEVPEINVSVNPNAHRIFVIDCSGSMYVEISQIRTHLKNKIPALTRPGDFISIIWFKDEDSFGCLQEHVSVASLEQLENLNKAIDRYLEADGGTYFADAMKLANSVADKYNEVAQIFFITDGMENTENASTLKAFKESKAAVVVVMYGYYTDKEYMQTLTDASNGVLLFSGEFEKLGESINTHLQNEVIANDNTVRFPSVGPAFRIADGEMKIYASLDGVCRIPVGMEVMIYSGNAEDELVLDDEVDYYSYLWFAVKTVNKDLIWNILQKSGDVYFIDQFYNCFTRQEFVLLEEDVKISYFDASKRYRKGANPNYIPREDCFTVIQLLNLLAADPKARMYPYHTGFKYERISKKVEEQGGKFFPTRELGSPFTLVYNSTRANVSLNCKVFGYRESEDGEIQTEQTYRNYTAIKDGVKNMVILPVSFSRETFTTLLQEGIVDGEWSANRVFEIPMEGIPVINRAMTKGKQFSAVTFCIAHVRKLKLQAIRKYLTSRNKVEKEPGEGEVAYEKKEKTPSIDSYKTRELIVKIAKCSSLPTVNEKLFAKFAAGKLTLSEKLMKDIHEEYEAAEDKATFSTERLAKVGGELKNVNDGLEQVKFGILAAKCWFVDSDEYGRCVENVEYEGEQYNVTVSIEEKIVQL